MYFFNFNLYFVYVYMWILICDIYGKVSKLYLMNMYIKLDLYSNWMLNVVFLYRVMFGIYIVKYFFGENVI